MIISELNGQELLFYFHWLTLGRKKLMETYPTLRYPYLY
nr:MAG TPA: TerB N-terminal domain [Caudoviricetes sp.]